MTDVTVVGGGLAGLINAIRINRAGFNVLLLERKKYPFHRVCGEYISNEVIPFLKSENLFPTELGPSNLTRFQLSSPNGKSFNMPLDLGGFGVSRYSFDHWLIKIAKKEGVQVQEGEAVEHIEFVPGGFNIRSRTNEYKSRLVVGCFGKRSTLDRDMSRDFISKPSPYLGVKYHLKTDLHPHNLISLHNFNGGYCGISRIENDTFNLCYLSERKPVREAGSIEEFEQKILRKNPLLDKLYSESDFLFDKPEVINEISFAPKEPVKDHVLMAGDSAGMITPLSGNGMAMAIHGAKICSDMVIRFLNKEIDRNELESAYTRIWNQTFRTRHWAGRKIQGLFGSGTSSGVAVFLGKNIRPVAGFMMKQTHGKPF